MNHTSRLHLPLFEATDKPSWLTDWNGAMNKLDEAISDLEIGNIPGMQDLLDRLVAVEASVTAGQEIMSAIELNFASRFNSATTYSHGDYCVYDHSLYKYTDPTPSSGDFDGTKWSIRSVSSIVEEIYYQINSAVSSINNEIGTDYTAGSIKGRITNVETEIGTDSTPNTIKGRITTLENGSGGGSNLSETQEIYVTYNTPHYQESLATFPRNTIMKNLLQKQGYTLLSSGFEYKIGLVPSQNWSASLNSGYVTISGSAYIGVVRPDTSGQFVHVSDVKLKTMFPEIPDNSDVVIIPSGGSLDLNGVIVNNNTLTVDMTYMPNFLSVKKNNESSVRGFCNAIPTLYGANGTCYAPNSFSLPGKFIFDPTYIDQLLPLSPEDELRPFGHNRTDTTGRSIYLAKIYYGSTSTPTISGPAYPSVPAAIRFYIYTRPHQS